MRSHIENNLKIYIILISFVEYIICLTYPFLCLLKMSNM